MAISVTGSCKGLLTAFEFVLEMLLRQQRPLLVWMLSRSGSSSLASYIKEKPKLFLVKESEKGDILCLFCSIHGLQLVLSNIVYIP
jgi:hypothetical protein